MSQPDLFAQTEPLAQPETSETALEPEAGKRLEAAGILADQYDISPLEGGYRNRIFRLKAKNGPDYVLRLPRDEIKSRQWYSREAKHLRLAADNGIAPAPRLMDEDDGLLIMPFISGEHPKNRQTTPDQAAAIGQTLAKLHNIADFEENETALQRIERRARRLREKRAGVFAHAQGLPSFQEACTPLIGALEATSPTPTAIHGDLVLGNILLQDKEGDGVTATILDWETAGLGDPLYDLATVSMRARLSGNGRHALVNSWSKALEVSLTPTLWARLTLWEMIYCLDKALTYWSSGDRQGTIDSRCLGWTRRGTSLMAEAGARAATVVVQQAANGYHDVPRQFGRHG